MIQSKYVNVYYDGHSNAWIREVMVQGRWTFNGTYGSRAAAERGSK